jgi:glycosyltransferase involved in cell wall biosynthesis
MQKPQISVIMLTHNRERLVGRMIECIRAQTFAEFEYIIVDNGSTDRSGAIADEYAEKDRRIAVLHKQRGNIGSGRNAGLDAACGEWIAFVDDDDYCRPDFLEFMRGLVRNDGIDVAICGASDKTKGESRTMRADDALEALYWRKLFNNQFPTKLIRRTLFAGIRFSATAKYDDIELMTYIISSARQVAYNGEPKYTFYRHDGNNSAWTTQHELLTADTLKEYLGVYRKRTEFLIGRFPNSAAKWRYFEWSFMLSMVEKIARLKLTDCLESQNLMLSELRQNRREFELCGYLQDFEKHWIGEYL